MVAPKVLVVESGATVDMQPTCDHTFVLIDQVPQLLVRLHIKGAFVIADSFHPREPETVPGGKVSADDGPHICLNLPCGEVTSQLCGAGD